jgi:hypothetical protein
VPVHIRRPLLERWVKLRATFVSMTICRRSKRNNPAVSVLLFRNLCSWFFRAARAETRVIRRATPLPYACCGPGKLASTSGKFPMYARFHPCVIWFHRTSKTLIWAVDAAFRHVCLCAIRYSNVSLWIQTSPDRPLELRILLFGI